MCYLPENKPAECKNYCRFFFASNAIKYVVRGPIVDGETRYGPASPLIGANWLFLLFIGFRVAALLPPWEIKTMERIIRDFIQRGVVTCQISATAVVKFRNFV